MEGEVALLRQSEAGDEFIVAIVGPGEVFAEDLVFLGESTHHFALIVASPLEVHEE
jgi:CRP-like cAMP-binding protein